MGDLRNYFEGLMGISLFYIIGRSFGKVEFDPVRRIVAVLDRIIVDLMAETVIVGAVNIGKDRADDALYIFLGIFGGISVDGEFIRFAVVGGSGEDNSGILVTGIELIGAGFAFFSLEDKGVCLEGSVQGCDKAVIGCGRTRI